MIRAIIRHLKRPPESGQGDTCRMIHTETQSTHLERRRQNLIGCTACGCFGVFCSAHLIMGTGLHGDKLGPEQYIHSLSVLILVKKSRRFGLLLGYGYDSSLGDGEIL